MSDCRSLIRRVLLMAMYVQPVFYWPLSTVGAGALDAEMGGLTCICASTDGI